MILVGWLFVFMLERETKFVSESIRKPLGQLRGDPGQDLPPRLLLPDELEMLCMFFELLARWEEASKNECGNQDRTCIS